jgi:hypothetical protein
MALLGNLAFFSTVITNNELLDLRYFVGNGNDKYYLNSINIFFSLRWRKCASRSDLTIA